MTIQLKKNDRLPLARAELTDANGAALDLTGATVTFKMRRWGTETLKIASASATVIDAPGGVVQYSWAAGDTDTPGTYDGEFVVTYGGLPMTVPGGNTVLVVIDAGL